MVQIKIDPSIQSSETHSQLNAYGIQVSEASKWSLAKSKSDNWMIVDSEKRKLEIDFDTNKHDYNRSHKGSGELIARSLGIKEDIKNVVDLSAGLGIDAVLLAQIGFQVTSVERCPILIFLLHEAQKKTTRKEVKGINWILSDSKKFLTDYKLESPTSCYFDPMYPEKKKTALPRQEMVIFRELVGQDTDAESTLKLALQKGFVRTSVKRPVKAEELIEKPDYHLASKLIRFDIYYPRQTTGAKL